MLARPKSTARPSSSYWLGLRTPSTAQTWLQPTKSCLCEKHARHAWSHHSLTIVCIALGDPFRYCCLTDLQTRDIQPKLLKSIHHTKHWLKQRAPLKSGKHQNTPQYPMVETVNMQQIFKIARSC
uniref:Uncharacterized protein n=1 Tax=Sphaerodactylus townsendi TaxID=933632 RepID=A0ACB8EAZ0_9SAUR